MENSFRLGNKFKQEGKLEEAISAYRAAIEQNPNFYWSYHNLGEVLAELGKWDEAVTHYRKAIALNPNFAWSHYYLGEVLMQLGKWGEAVAAYRSAIEIEPKSYQFHHKLGETLYQISLKIDQESLQTYINLAEVLFESHHFQGAETELYDLNDEVFLQATEDFNDKDFIEEVYRTYLKREGDQDGTNHYCRELANGMSRGEIISGFRGSQEFKNKLVESLQTARLCYLYVRAIDDIFLEATREVTDEIFIEHLYHIYLKREPDGHGKVFYLKQLNDGVSREDIIAGFRVSDEFNSKLISSTKSVYLEELIRVYRHVTEISPKPHKLANQLENLAQSYCDRGAVFWQMGNLEEAIEMYSHAITTNPNIAEAYYCIGGVFAHNCQLEEAVDSYLKAKKLMPNQALSKSISRGQKICYQIQEELEESVFNIPDVDVSQIKSPAIDYFYQGITQVKEGKLKAALESYNMAVVDEPEFAQAHLQMGNICSAIWRLSEDNNKINDAVFHYERAITVNPDILEAHFKLGNMLEILLTMPDPVKEEYIPNEVIDCWKQVTLLEPKSSTDSLTISMAHLKIGDTLVRQGELCEGMFSVQKSVEKHRHFVEQNPLLQEGMRFIFNNRYSTTSEWPKAIGHISMHIDLCLKMGLLGWRPSKEKLVALVYPDEVANRCLLDYWNKYINIIYEPQLIHSLMPLAKQLEYLEYNLCYVTNPDGRKCLPPHQLWTIEKPNALWLVQKQWEEEGREPLLSLSRSDFERGWSCLEEMGLPKNAWFVCLHVREPGYKGDQTAHRNAELNTHLLAVKAIVNNGGWVIRMGDHTMTNLPPMERVIDYALSKFKSDWMDVFLWSQGKFYLGANSGVYCVHNIFGVPAVMTNAFPLAVRPFSKHDIFMPKLYYSELEERYLTFLEALSPHFSDVRHNGKKLSSMSIKVMDNTPEEINDLVIEMIERLNGTIKYTKEDNLLQDQFNALITQSTGYPTPNSRIGKSFLRKYANLL